MENFWVAEESEGIGEAVRRQLGERDRRTAAGGSPWLLVVSPRAAERRRQLPTGCRTVLLPGGAGGLLSGLDPAAAVSYGTGPRDTLTLSSREGRQLWCAIQRELVTVEGRVVERQELPLRLPDHMSPLSVLAAAGALLLLGVPLRSWAGTAGRSGAARDERPAAGGVPSGRRTRVTVFSWSG